MKPRKLIISAATAFSLFILGCTANTNALTKISVNKTINIAVSQTEEREDSIIPVLPYLIEETIHISELVRYPQDNGLITIPFNFSDTKKYADITEANLEKRIAISVNGNVIYTPVVKAKLNNGACLVLLTKEQAEQLFPDTDINQLFKEK